MDASDQPSVALITRDPVCGMEVDPAASGLRSTQGGHDYHFCSEHCHETFAAAPEEYLTSEDPVCGMKVDRAYAKYLTKHAGTRVYFCSSRCHEKFEADPEAYADGRPTPEPMPEGTIYTCLLYTSPSPRDS